MDCCGSKSEHESDKLERELKEKKVKGGKDMTNTNKKTMMWIVIGLLVVATIFLTFKASSIGTGAAQATALAARTAVSTASSGMVGGC